MILVDQAVWPWRGRRWAHLVSDSDYDELHAFALAIGLRRLAFQGDHYDVDAVTRLVAIEAGASAVDARDLVRRLRSAGLRCRRDRAELAWTQSALWPAAVLDGRSEQLLGTLSAAVGDGVAAAMADELRAALRGLEEPLEIRLLTRPGEVALVLDRPGRQGLPMADVVAATP